MFSNAPGACAFLPQRVKFDARRTSIPESEWVTIQSLLATLSWPLHNRGKDLIIHAIPADGSCLFFTILVIQGFETIRSKLQMDDI